MTTPVERAAAILVQARAEQRARTPRDAAERAYRAGGPSIDELERRITARRQHVA